MISWRPTWVLWLSFWLCLLPLGLAQSRVGNDLQLDGFSAPLPEPYTLAKRLSEDRFQLLTRAPIMNLVGGPIPVAISAERLISYNADLGLLSPQQFQAELEQWPFAELRRIDTRDECVHGFIGRIGNQVVALSSWGQGRGQVFYGPNRPEVWRVIFQIIQGIELLPGACGWTD